MGIAVLSNVNMDSLIKRLNKKYDVYQPAGYGNWIKELANNTSDCWKANPDAVFLIFDGEQLIYNKMTIEEMKEEIDQVILFVKNAVRCHQNTHFFVSSIDIKSLRIRDMKTVVFEREIENYYYQKLIELNNEYDHFVIFDLKHLVEEYGRKYFYSEKLWYYGGMPFSMQAEKEIEKEIVSCMNALLGHRKKCLVVDLDNTLWGGVIGEDGLEGLDLEEQGKGARYRDFQRRIKEIQDVGVILAVVSKNNLSDVQEVFLKHKAMVLVEDDFVATKINWLPKHENIKEIASELNIGLDSLVFIDDMPVERQTVASQLPDVTVPKFPEDTADLSNFAMEIYRNYFRIIQVNTEDKKKTVMYKENAKRQQELHNSNSYEEFLQSLQTKITLWKAGQEDVGRIAQLTQKTNQFNVMTKRYTEQQVKELLEKETINVYIGSVQDKYGDNGKVIVVIVRKEGTEAEFDTFLMSCRVMGRYIEEQVLRAIEHELYQQGIRHVTAYYEPTQKNKPVEQFFENMQYQLISTDLKGAKQYSFQLKDDNKIARKAFGELILREDSSYRISSS